MELENDSPVSQGLPSVFAFEWCDCIYESGYCIQSLHTTRKGALKAMMLESNARWLAGRQLDLEFGDGQDSDPLKYQRWRVRPIPLQP